MKGVRTAILVLAAGCTSSACADFASEGMTGGLGENGGSSSGGSESSTSSTSVELSGTTAAMSTSSTGEPGDESDTGSPSSDSAASTGPDETTGPQTGFQDGTYMGPLDIEMMSSLGTYNCVGTMTLTVTEDDETPVVGDGTCDVVIAGVAVEGVMQLTGQLALPLADGPATLTTDFDTANTTWNGSFAGDTFTGSFNGVYTYAGYSVNYNGTWTADR